MAKDNKNNTIISLGFYCGISTELMKYGIREASYPFDWVISSLEGVLNAVSNHFECFISKKYMYQNIQNKDYFLNNLYKIEFYHDFTKYKPLGVQLRSVRKKYKRRIKRFFRTIEKPCLFIRYIKDKDELLKVPRLLDKIEKLLLSRNKNNEMIFFCNDDLLSEKQSYGKITIIPVKKDVNSSFCQNPIEKSGLKERLMNEFGHVNKISIEKYKVLFQPRKPSFMELVKNRLFKKKVFNYKKQYYVEDGNYCLLKAGHETSKPGASNF